MSRVAYDRSGKTIAIADGAEILVYDGDSEAPLWRKTLGASIVAVGSTPSFVFALEESGKLTRFGATQGDVREALSLDASPRGLAVSRGGACAVAYDGRVEVLEAEGRARVAVEGATALAFSDDGSALAVGTKAGALAIRDLAGTTPLAVVTLGGDPVRGVAFHAGGMWIATSGEKVHRVDHSTRQAAVLTRTTGHLPSDVACSADGAFVALQLGESTMVVLAMPSRDTAAQVSYLDRKIVGVALGPSPWFAVGMDKGDGNKISLRSGAVHRTDTHPGRAHNSWMLSSNVEQAVVAAASGPPRAAPRPPPARPAPVLAARERSPRSYSWLGLIPVVVLLLTLARRCME